MNPEQRIETLEDTVKVLKNEINTVLLDIREHYLNLENPFAQYCQAPPEPAPFADDTEEEPEPEPEPDVDLTFEESQPRKEELEDFEDFPPVTSKPISEIPEEYKTGIKKRMDWVTVVGLTRWAERATTKLGKAKVEALIEVYHTTGCLSDSFKELLVKLVRLSEASVHIGQVTSKDYLSILVQLESILNGDGQREAALLSILSDGGDPNR